MKKYLSVFLAFILVSALFVSASALNMTSADQILAGSDGHDLAGFGGNNKDDTQLGFIEEDTFTAWGWYSTENESGIAGFGYEYNNIAFLNSEKYYGEDADIIAQQCGGVGESVRFRVEIPVIGGEDVHVDVVAEMNDGTLLNVWSITYSSNNERTLQDIINEHEAVFEELDPDKLNIVADGGLAENYACAGDIVDVKVRLINNDIISSCKVKVIWDENLTLLNANYDIFNPEDKRAIFAYPEDEDGNPDWTRVGQQYVFNWLSTNRKYAAKGDCDYLTLTFKIADDCPVGFLPISLIAEPEDIFDDKDINIPFKTIDGGIDVVEFEKIDPDKLNIVVDGGLDMFFSQNGDVVDVSIRLINNDIISSARLNVKWDERLTLLNAEYDIYNPRDKNALIHTPDVLDEYGDPDWSSVGNSYIFNWIAGNEKFFPTGDCTFVTLSFLIDKYCETDFLDVEIEAIDEDDFYYTDGTDIYGIPVNLIDGGVHVTYVEPYDPYKYVERDYEEIRDGVLNIVVDGALEKNEARAGDLVDIKVNLVNNTLGLSSLRGRVFWSDKLELVSVKYDIAEQGSTNYLVNEPDLNEDLEPAWDELDENAFVLNWVDFDETVYGDVTFATLTFRLKNNIGYNEFLPVYIDVDPVDVFYGLGHHVPFETLDGGIDTLVDIMPGDLDYNGKINNMDFLMLFRHLNDRLDRKVAFGTVDVNEDGSVNNKDVVRLFDMATALDR